MTQNVRLLAGDRKKRETKTAILACNDHLRMGPGRSLVRLLERYTKSDQKEPPTRSLATLKKWSARYDWQARADLHDARVEEEKNRRRQEIMESGLALDYERVARLKQLADLLMGETYTIDDQGNAVMVVNNVWLPDVKQIGGGELAERVDIVRFNSSLLEQLRGVLDDLAKETGGRRQRTVTENIDYGKLTDEQLARIAAGEDPVQVILSEYTSRSG